MRRRNPHLSLLIVSEVLLALLGLFAGTGSLYPNFPSPASGRKPLWSIHPSAIGFKRNGKLAFTMPVGNAHIKPLFLDPQRVAFAWFVPDHAPVPFPRPLTDLPGRIHISIHDARTGQEIGNHDWQSPSRWVDLTYTADGQWLTVSNGRLTLWSTSFEKLSEMTFKETRARNVRMNPPNTRTLIIETDDVSGGDRYEMLDSHTFNVLNSWVGRSWDVYRHSNSYVAGAMNEVLSILAIGDTWKTLFLSPAIFDLSQPPLPRGPGRYIVPLGFATEDTLVIAPSPPRNRLAVISIAGQVLLSAKLKGKREFDSDVSSGGGRFAVLSTRERGSETLDMQYWADEMVHVYDVGQGAEICLIEVKGDSEALFPFHQAFHWNSVAVSPDGTLLAIASDYGLRVYALPRSDASGR